MLKPGIKELLADIFPGKVITENLDKGIPSFFDLYPQDINTVADDELEELIQNNYDSFYNLSTVRQQKIARWWYNEYGDKCENIGGDDITETELIQYISEEGFIIK